MTRKPGKFTEGQKWEGLVHISILFVCFLGAGLAGCFVVSASGESGVSALSTYLNGYMEILEEGAAVPTPLWTVIWELCRWPFFVFLLGLTALGTIAIPAVFLVRGFLLGYSIASFVRVFGTAGLLAASAMLGTTALASVPVLFCVGTLTFPNSLRLAAGVLESKPISLFSKEQLWSIIPCGVIMALAIAMEWSVVPQFLTLVAGMLSKT